MKNRNPSIDVRWFRSWCNFNLTSIPNSILHMSRISNWLTQSKIAPSPSTQINRDMSAGRRSVPGKVETSMACDVYITRGVWYPWSFAVLMLTAVIILYVNYIVMKGTRCCLRTRTQIKIYTSLKGCALIHNIRHLEKSRCILWCILNLR